MNGGSARWEVVSVRGSWELAISGKTLFAMWKPDIFELGGKTRTARKAKGKSKGTALREIRKTKNAEEVCREWYGMYCVEETYAE